MSKKNSIGQSPLVYDSVKDASKRALVAALAAFLLTPSAVEAMNNFQASSRSASSETDVDSSISPNPHTNNSTVAQPIFRGYFEICDTLVLNPDGKKLVKYFCGADGKTSKLLQYGFRDRKTDRLEVRVPSSDAIAYFLDTTHDDNHFVKLQVWSDSNGLPRSEVVYNDDHSLKSITLYNFSGQPSFRRDFNDEIVAGSLVIKNNQHGTIAISRIDEATQKELPGATLVLKDSNGKVLAKWVSTDKPESFKNLLQPGKYTLEEVMAPEGYDTNKAAITFMVDKNGRFVSSTAINDGVEKPIDVTNEEEYKKIEAENGAIIERLNLKVDENHQIIYDENGKICGSIEVIGKKNTVTMLGNNGEITKVIEINGKKETTYNYAGKAGEEGIASYVVIEYGDDNFVKHAECIGTNGLPLCEADYNGKNYVLKLYDVYGTSVYSTVKHTEDDNEDIMEVTNEHDITTNRVVFNKKDCTTFRASFNEDGSKKYEVTGDDNLENGVSFYGKPGSEIVMNEWTIGYWGDGLTRKYKLSRDAEGNPVRYEEYDEKGDPILNIEWDAEGKPFATLGNIEDARYLAGLLEVSAISRTRRPKD